MFLGAGSVITALHHEQDIRKMGGLFKKIPITGWTFLAGWLAICGVVPFAGFFSKDEILWKAFSTENALLPWLPKALWIVAFLAAGLTAAYMTRLVVLTFFGKSRVEPEKESHIHESPISMTAPLVVLAIGSLLAGFLGTPALLGLGPNRFDEWLHPVFAAGQSAAHSEQVDATHGSGEGDAAGHGGAHADPAAAGHASDSVGGHDAGLEHAHHDVGLEWTLMIASLVLALLAIFVAWRVYSRRPDIPEKIASSFGGLYRLVRDKYRVDELYDAVIVRPLVSGSSRVLHAVIDVKIIDFTVNFVGILAKIGSYGFRFFQTGYVQAYAFIILLGLAVILIGVL